MSHSTVIPLGPVLVGVQRAADFYSLIGEPRSGPESRTGSDPHLRDVPS